MIMTLEDGRNIATMVAAVIAVFGIILALVNLKKTEQSVRFRVYIDILDMCESVRDARLLLYEKVPKEPSNTSLTGLTPDEVNELDGLTRVFDRLGLLVKHGVVPESFIFDFYSRPLVVAWHRLEPRITEERRKREQPGYMRKFEILAIRAKNYRDKTHPGQETFRLTNEQKESWKVWKK